MASLISFAYGVTLTLATSTILEMHGDQNLAVVYGLQMMLYGTGYSVSAPFAGEKSMHVWRFKAFPMMSGVSLQTFSVFCKT